MSEPQGGEGILCLSFGPAHDNAQRGILLADSLGAFSRCLRFIPEQQMMNVLYPRQSHGLDDVFLGFDFQSPIPVDRKRYKPTFTRHNSRRQQLITSDGRGP